uniref:Uncharacterized protein n=1 Tax=Ananas comosus var. bracteatus TaxID=296719 RepID=A0A6V7Q9H3_ANACO|nr:unnamed protein product [Ananas comosus var. bracteatus]
MEARGLLLLRAFSSLPLRLPCRRNPVSPHLPRSLNPFPPLLPLLARLLLRGPTEVRSRGGIWWGNGFPETTRSCGARPSSSAALPCSPFFLTAPSPESLPLLMLQVCVLLRQRQHDDLRIANMSRVDILTLALAVTDILTGLVWLSIRPKVVSPVVPQGVECERIKSGIANRAVLELLWYNIFLS